MNAELSPRARSIGVVVWCSFLTACGATTVLFAFFDPEMLMIGRLTAYGVGFFFFWGVAACAAALSIYMARTENSGYRGP